ncbi:DUF956 family protein [Lactococcus kimchii]|uniref:DUF956 family protein n=1 Tax=Lactococcus sp. S-13 TaxID=2507158 RepID=UPI00102388BD|nr:DUF956 family protein [Lactococcus sp. S-13]RZI48918.1 DUF956 family protein [Lactococcus sp. S-13]
MVKSLNTRSDFTAKGIAYVGLGNSYGQFMLGDKAFEFFDERNVSNFIQIPWDQIALVQADVSKKGKISRHFTVQLMNRKSRLRFSSPDSGHILRLIRDQIGNEKVVRAPGFFQSLKSAFTFKRKTKNS